MKFRVRFIVIPSVVKLVFHVVPLREGGLGGLEDVAIVIDNCFVPLPVVLVALTVNVDVPAVDGVPVIAPVAESVKPVGNVPLSRLHVMGVSPGNLSILKKNIIE